ncbi:MAG: hypothetical protein QCH99_08200 [Candidatus Bathyarchaeota archaeon]|nr:hypothetical protein [Candidatus Bathyarchaeum tardum]
MKDSVVQNDNYNIFDAILIVLFFLGLGILIWVVQIVFKDVTFYEKSVFLSLFGSRVGENIDLGIGFLLVNYLIIAVFLLLFSLFAGYRKHKDLVNRKMVNIK